MKESTQLKITNAINQAIKDTQAQQKALQKSLSKQKGFLHVKSVYLKISMKREVNRRLAEWYVKEKEKDPNAKKYGGPDKANNIVASFDLTKLANEKTQLLGKEIGEQFQARIKQIRETEGGMFAFYRKKSKEEKASIKEEIRKAKLEAKEERDILERAQKSEKTAFKIRMDLEKQRIEREVLEKYANRGKAPDLER